jgi:hypothetical protein
MTYTFRCNDVLNPKKVHDSLAQLLEMPGWRKLGGRLCRDVSYEKTGHYLQVPNLTKS